MNSLPESWIGLNQADQDTAGPIAACQRATPIPNYPVATLSESMKQFLIAFSIVLLASPVFAEISVPNFFGDHMVLQQGGKANLWGHADAGVSVTVAFKDAQAETKAGPNGKWSVGISTGMADSKGADLTITSGKDSLKIKDVLVGEVWLASGQSNMAFTVSRSDNATEEIAAANYPGLRMFNAPTVTAAEPMDNIAGSWTLTSPETAGSYSAVAYFFARKLHKELGVPVGVIKTAWGGKPVETFTSRKALSSIPETKEMVSRLLEADKTFDPGKANQQYEKRLESWNKAVKAWRETGTAAGRRAPRRPGKPKRPLLTEGQPGVLYNAMIHPFVGYTMKGAIWYQGEANAKEGKVPYDITLPLMINDWRSRWGTDFSFLYVQLANFKAATTDPGDNDPWPLLQNRMRLVLDTTLKTGMATINDVGAAKDIHPKNKQDAGARLARWALFHDYGKKDVVYSGPLYAESKTEGNVITVKFESVGAGLKSRDGKALERFEVQDANETWHWATAEIRGKDFVRISSKSVSNPVAARYAWAANPEGANLVNSEGLPTSVFSTK